MELQQLRVFLMVAELASVTKAAQALYLTPPSVSAQIKALEQELHVLLFTRTATGMLLTTAGAQLRVHAEATVRAAAALRTHAETLHDQVSGEIVLGLNAMPSMLRAASLLSRLNTDYPGISITALSASTGRILDGIYAKSMDGGFIFGVAPGDGIHTIALRSLDLVVAAPPTWPSPPASVTWAALAQHPWITMSRYCPFQSQLDAIFVQQGVSYRQVLVADDDAVRRDLVSQGVGISLLEREEAEQAADQDTLVIWPVAPTKCRLSFAYAAPRTDEPCIRALVQTVSGVWNVSHVPAG